MVATKKEWLDRVIYKEMATLIDPLFFLITFVVQHVFRYGRILIFLFPALCSRTKLEDGASKARRVCVLGTIPEVDESEEEDFFDLSEEEEEEEYTSSFSFKFEHQVPGLESISKEETPILATEEDFSDKRESICIDQFLNLSKFKEPEAMTDSESFSSAKDFKRSREEPDDVRLSQHESFADREDVASKYLPPNDFNEPFVMLSKEDEENAEPKSLPEEEFRNSFIDSIDLIFSNDEHFVSRSNEFLSSKCSEKSIEELKGVNEPFIGTRESKFLSEKWYSKYFAKHKEAIFPKDENLGEEEPAAAAAAVETEAWGEKEAAEGFSGFGTDSDWTSSSDGYSVKNLVVDCDSDGFLSEKDFGEDEILMDSNRIEESPMPSSSSVLIEFTDSSDDELPWFKNNSTNARHLSPSNGLNRVDRKSKESDTKDLDAEDMDDQLESLWEHQDLIEQLKMELKKARATGLPTSVEEAESPKAIEDLKRWRIDDQFLHEDPMDELHRFYKSYRERMRKFDILNYQKLYAIGSLQLKIPIHSMGSQKPLFPTILSHLSQKICALHCHKSSPDASETFIKELQVDLETVYVGQTCLSWEFLRWQYEQARELPESDPYRKHQYSQVAGEFQKFHVILRRFIENESFEGPRLPTYVQHRCILRNLLQVPVIKEDCLKDKMEEWGKGVDTITSEVLEDIMEESIRTFWDFIKADKDETSPILKSLIGGDQVELQDPSDYDLMADVQATLHKKEKKLKDILKTGNCIAKRLKKPREDGSLHQDLFFSHVDVKLVSRVLKMSRITTDQLSWCRAKLNKITIAGRKIHRDPSFLLFPC